MQARDRREFEVGLPILTRTFLIAVAVWTIASIVLAIPHGRTHSIQSMTAFVVLRAAAFPIWLAAFVCIAAGLAVRGWRALDSKQRPAEPPP